MHEIQEVEEKKVTIYYDSYRQTRKRFVDDFSGFLRLTHFGETGSCNHGPSVSLGAL